MKILNCQQGSTEWSLARAGCVTASEVDSLVTSKWEPRTGEGVNTYLYRKLSERVMGYQMDGGGTFAMGQGQILEQQAVPWFEFAHNVTVQRVGFCTTDDGKRGCSPDGLIGEFSGLEIKSPMNPKHLQYLMDGKVPAEYLPQIHYSMMVTGRKDWWFVSYSAHLPKLVIRVLRDDAICERLDAITAGFIARLDAEEARLRAMMDARAKNQSRE